MSFYVWFLTIISERLRMCPSNECILCMGYKIVVQLLHEVLTLARKCCRWILPLEGTYTSFELCCKYFCSDFDISYHEIYNMTRGMFDVAIMSEKSNLRKKTQSFGFSFSQFSRRAEIQICITCAHLLSFAIVIQIWWTFGFTPFKILTNDSFEMVHMTEKLLIPHPVASEHRWLVKAPRWIHSVSDVSRRRSWRCGCHARLWNLHDVTNTSRL